jgi:hypothetical protein
LSDAADLLPMAANSVRFNRLQYTKSCRLQLASPDGEYKELPFHEEWNMTTKSANDVPLQPCVVGFRSKKGGSEHLVSFAAADVNIRPGPAVRSFAHDGQSFRIR